ncbi:transposase [Limosilactobacillus difficilis]
MNYFKNRYSITERQLVNTVVVDMNTQYSHSIHRLFPKAQIIIGRFHIT